MAAKFLSRKFILTVLVLGLSAGLPVVYSKVGVSEIITLTVLAILGGVGTAYGFLNVKNQKLDAVLSKKADDGKASE